MLFATFWTPLLEAACTNGCILGPCCSSCDRLKWIEFCIHRKSSASKYKCHKVGFTSEASKLKGQPSKLCENWPKTIAIGSKPRTLALTCHHFLFGSSFFSAARRGRSRKGSAPKLQQAGAVIVQVTKLSTFSHCWWI